MASAALTITQMGGRSKSALRCPEATSASAMIPIVFWASFVPCVKATKPPEIELQPPEDAVDEARGAPAHDPHEHDHERRGADDAEERRQE